MPCLDQNVEWGFEPSKELRIGSLITGGDVIGYVNENTLFQNHKIMADPKAAGKIIDI